METTREYQCRECENGVIKITVYPPNRDGFSINVNKCTKCGYLFKESDFDDYQKSKFLRV